MYIVISIFLLFYTVFGHEGHVHSGQTNDIKEFVKNQEEKAAQQNFEQKDVMQVVPKTYGQMPNMMQAQNIGQPQMPGQQPPPQILQLLQMLLSAQNGQMRPMNGQMPPMNGQMPPMMGGKLNTSFGISVMGEGNFSISKLIL
jgi:hypothetical protein